MSRNKLSHAEEQRMQALINQQQVLMLTGLSWSEYCEMQESYGIQYLGHLLLGNDSSKFDDMRRDGEFWAWWKVCWNRRDEQFLRNMEAQLQPEPLVDAYRIYHSPINITLYPAGVIKKYNKTRKICKK